MSDERQTALTHHSSLITHHWRVVVALALLLGVGLRGAGLGWGLPGPGRNYPYHPDEPLVALATLRIDFGALQLSPRDFHYGSLPFYLDRLAVDGAARVGGINLAPATRRALARTVGATIRIGRWLTVVMGLLTIAATAALGGRLFGAPAGAVAALLLSLAPLHLAQGHYNTVDVPATFWTTLCLVLCAGALREPSRGALAAAGACAGLAASTKYNAGLVMFAPLFTLAATWRREEWYASDRAAAVIYTPLAAAAAFLLTTPGILIDSATFWHDFRYELGHAAAGHGLVFAHTPPAWLYHLTRSLPEGLGLPLALAAVAGVGWAVARHSQEDGLLLLFVLPYFFLIGTSQVKFARYVVPMLPALLVLAARLLTGSERCKNGVATAEASVRSARQNTAAIRAIIAAVVVLWTGAYGIAMAAVFTRADPRDQAADWLLQVRRRGERVAVAGEPWFYTPPLAPALGCTHLLQPVCGEPPPAWIVAPGPGQVALQPADLARARPAYVVVSEFEYADPLRLQAETGYSDRMTRLMAALRERYRLVHFVRNRPSLGPFRWFTARTPVHDLLYPMPDVRIYRRW